MTVSLTHPTFWLSDDANAGLPAYENQITNFYRFGIGIQTGTERVALFPCAMQISAVTYFERSWRNVIVPKNAYRGPRRPTYILMRLDKVYRRCLARRLLSEEMASNLMQGKVDRYKNGLF